MEVNLIKKFDEIYKQESDAIFRFCVVRISDREQSLDLTQETFMRLWKSINEGQKIENHRAFLFTVVRRLIIDWYRKKKSVSLDSILQNIDGESQSDFIDENTENDNLISEAEGRYLIDKINKISSSNRDSVYLRFIEDLSPPEIAKILNISANAVSVRINRGLEELRKITGYSIEEK